jgi:L-2,4-diaminobutyrate decarboxylase
VVTLDNVKNLLDMVLAESDRIKDDIAFGRYTPAID